MIYYTFHEITNLKVMIIFRPRTLVSVSKNCTGPIQRQFVLLDTLFDVVIKLINTIRVIIRIISYMK